MKISDSYTIEVPKSEDSIIKVIGVGGGGSNAVNYMKKNIVEGVELIVCNTDKQALDSSDVTKKLQIGSNLTSGLGAGANPLRGQEAALESRDEIRKLLEHTKMLFITAGMGGGTGTGAAPIIASIAKEMGILVVGIVTFPFSWEGQKKKKQAGEGIEELKKNCDSIIIILNDKVSEIYPELDIDAAFMKVDDILLMAAKGIAEIITKPGIINVDFEDVRTTMENSGTALMGSAVAEGVDKAKKAVESAVEAPLLGKNRIKGAKKALISIVGGTESNLLPKDMVTINEYVQEKTGGAEIIFGWLKEEELGEKVQVTVIITGFEATDENNEPEQEEQKEQEEQEEIEKSTIAPENKQEEKSQYVIESQKSPNMVVQNNQAEEETKEKVFNFAQKTETPINTIPLREIKEVKDEEDVLPTNEPSEEPQLVKATPPSMNAPVTLQDDEKESRLRELEQERIIRRKQLEEGTYVPKTEIRKDTAIHNKNLWSDPLHQHSTIGKYGVDEKGNISKNDYFQNKPD